ncbi:hypothetical protein EGR52_08085 [bacterium]|nr:hypothetical protein [bacterium]
MELLSLVLIILFIMLLTKISFFTIMGLINIVLLAIFIMATISCIKDKNYFLSLVWGIITIFYLFLLLA